MPKSRLVIPALVLVVLADFGCTASREEPGTLSEGVWGGEHIRMTVMADHADIEYDCAHGTMKLPADFESGGHFISSGTHTSEGGPAQLYETQDVHPARFEGVIIRNTIALRVTLTDSGQSLGQYFLTEGSPGQLFKCL